MKKLSITKIVTLLLVSTMAFTFVACKKTDDASIALSAEKTTLDLYEQITITATTQKVTEKIKWESSDDAKATVDSNGLVSALSVGQVTITAEANGVSDSIVFDIVDSQTVPTLSLDYELLQLNVDNEIIVTATVKFKNQVQVINDLTWESDDDDIFSVTPTTLGKAKVKALKNGESTLTVKTTHMGLLLQESINVTVAGELNMTIENLTPTEDGYFISLDRIVPLGHEDEFNNTFTPNVKIVVNGNEVDKQPTWSVKVGNDDNIVSIEDGKITALNVGHTILLYTYTDEKNGSITGELNIEVNLPEVKLSETFDLDLHENQAIVTIPDLVVGDIQTLSIDGNKMPIDLTSNPGSIEITSLANIDFGKQTMNIKTDLASYNIDVLVATLIISNKEEFDLIPVLSKAATTNPVAWDGYFILDQDFSYNGAFNVFSGWNQGAGDKSSGFVGTFDGRGHVIDGLIMNDWVGGIFSTLGESGVVKNVAFTNAQVNVPSGFISHMNHGTIENVMVMGSMDTIAANPGNDRAGMVVSQLFPTGILKNVVAVVTSISNNVLPEGLESGALVSRVVVENGIEGIIENSYVYTPTVIEAVSGREDTDNVKTFRSIDDLAVASIEMNTFDASIWNLNGQLPVFESFNASIEENIQTKGITNIDKGLAVNSETKLTTDMKNLVYFTLLDAPEGVTLENDKIIVSNLPTLIGESVTVSVISIFDSYILHTEEFVINSVGIMIEGNFADIEMDRPDSGETVNLDLSTIEGISGNIISVYADNHLMENIGTNLIATFNKSDFPKRFGEQNLNIKVSDGSNEYNYSLTVTLASLIVENASDLLLMRNIGYQLGGDIDVQLGENTVSMIKFDGHFILANNIDCAGMIWDDHYNFFTNNHGWESALFDGAGFQGTIDGRGYMLNGLNTSGQGFIARFGSKGVLKNIGIQGSFEGTWGGYVSNHFAGTIENVYINVSVPAVHGTLGFPSNILTGDFSASGSKINNVIIVFDTPVHYNNVSSPLMGVYRPETHSDVYAVNTTGNVAGTLQDAGETVKTFVDVETFKTFIENSNNFNDKWNHYWDTTGDYPVFHNAY